MRGFQQALLFSTIATMVLAFPAVSATHLKVGDTAPDFTLPSTQGQPVTLSQFKDKKNVVLAFYPAAFTGGCTKEMQAYQFNLAKFDGADTQVFGVSTDNVPSQNKFAQDLGVTFPMLSDFLNREVSEKYGVLNKERGLSNRTTFVIDKKGVIQHVEEGQSAVDVTGAATACSRLAKP